MVAVATAIRRKRGPSLSRRTGQRGSVFQKGISKAAWNPEVTAYGRFWIDVPGEARRRQTVSLGVCPTKSVAKRKLRDYIEESGINDEEFFKAATAPAITFRSQANVWIDALAKRKRKPVKPATIYSWRNCLDKWLLPILGDMPLVDVANAAMKMLVNKLSAAGLSAKSIVNYCMVVKLVVASAVNDEGEQVYPRKWNHDFVGLPIVDKNKQRRPTLTPKEVTAIIEAAGTRYKPFFALLAGTGLRIGEALGLKVADFDHDCRTLFVKRSIWNGKEQDPKTPNAVRTVDLPAPLASLMQEYVSGKKGYLFATRSGRPLGKRNVHRTLHTLNKSVWFHAFRRFRTSVLRKSQVPEDLIQLWLGHSGATITDAYARQLREDIPFRQEWTEKAGLGFELVPKPEQLGYLGLPLASKTEVAFAA
jgi:integrase